MTKKNPVFIILFVSLSFLIMASCASRRLEKSLDPESREFLSKVRYLITRQERKIFLNLPPSEREAFIKEFWKKRDPTPETDKNEFKDRYFARIEEANHLFREGGTPGWLQDRGRIYILIGPPENREKYPTGYRFQDRPTEVWYYGPFPILFIDYSYTGDYELYPASAEYIAHLLKAQMDLKPDIQKVKVVFDFELKVEKLSENQIKILMEVPYKGLWLVERNEKLETNLLLTLEILSDSEERVWDFQEEYPVSVDQDQIAEILGKNLLIEVETELSPGKYSIKALLENKTDGNKVRKILEFSL